MTEDESADCEDSEVTESDDNRGETNAQEARCLAEANNGLYITAGTQEDLANAFKRTLACPMVSNTHLGELRPVSKSP